MPDHSLVLDKWVFSLQVSIDKAVEALSLNHTVLVTKSEAVFLVQTLRNQGLLFLFLKGVFSNRAKPSRWTNLIKSTLSTNIPALFLSGAKELGTSGWWKLAACRPLRPFLTLPAPSTSTEGENRKRMRASKNEDPHPKRKLWW